MHNILTKFYKFPLHLLRFHAVKKLVVRRLMIWNIKLYVITYYNAYSFIINVLMLYKMS